ncbi:transglutaminase-like cysteine peptidase [Mesorhizobium sp. M0955]
MRFLVFAFSLLSLLVCSPAQAVENCTRCDQLGLASWFTYSGKIWQLQGVMDLCERQAEICKGALSVQIQASDELLDRLQGVNTFVNFAVSSQSDSEHYGKDEYWTIPTDGKGDCEDYVLEKRQILIEKGIPAGALQIIEVELISTGEGMRFWASTPTAVSTSSTTWSTTLRRSFPTTTIASSASRHRSASPPSWA